ncbi:MAG: hypothetical protein V4558_13400 [Gemmatimonadota bacterium]
MSNARRCWFLLPFTLAACTPSPPQETVIPATDYAFQTPKEMPAGPATFRLDNRGKVPHEMALGQLKVGISADSMLAYASKGGDPGDLADGVVGILIAPAGQRSLGTVSATLVAGRTYVMICQFKDADSLPPHIAMGMQASFIAK